MNPNTSPTGNTMGAIPTGGQVSAQRNIQIMEVSNGWLVTLDYANKKVAKSGSEVVQYIKEYLNLGEDVPAPTDDFLPF